MTDKVYPRLLPCWRGRHLPGVVLKDNLHYCGRCRRLFTVSS